MKRRIAYTALLIGLILIAYNVVDRIEQYTEARLAQAEAYRDGCLPAAGETAVIVSNGRQAHCRIYRSASISTGMAPMLVSAAVVEVQP